MALQSWASSRSKRVAVYDDILGVHIVARNLLTLDGLERPGTHVEGELVALDAVVVDVVEHFLGEVESGRRCCHRAFNLRVDGLIGCLVAVLGLAVQVWRYWQFADGIENLGEGY